LGRRVTAKKKKKNGLLRELRNWERKYVNLMFVDPCIVVQLMTLPDNVQQLHVRQPSTVLSKPEITCVVLGS
jgi:hypothetical protein